MYANVLRNKDFSWDVRFTGTANKNKIIKLATEKPIENTLTIRKVGEAYNTFYMPEYAEGSGVLEQEKQCGIKDKKGMRKQKM